MPEGITEAANAFAAELNPRATPEPVRDGGGRFTSKPEPIFQERRVEGDPVTGDTRDGGEDPRLAARERRIADGRTDERDEDQRPARGRARQAPAEGEGEGGERSVQRRSPERGDAEADEGHSGAPSEQDEPGADKPGDEAPEHDQQDDQVDAEAPHYEVTVDGKTEVVSLNEALRGYIRESTFHQRMNQVHDARQAIEADHQSNQATRTQLAERLQYLDRMMQELIPAPPDWDREFQSNPAAAREKQKAYQTVYDKIHGLRAQYDQVQTEARREYDQRSEKYAVTEFSQFVADANIPDEPTLQSKLTLMKSYGQKIGFAEHELATVYDRRMLRVLLDAAEADAGRVTMPKAVIPGKGRTLTPGVATPVGTATRRNIDDAQNRLAKTGRLDDAALVFQRLIR